MCNASEPSTSNSGLAESLSTGDAFFRIRKYGLPPAECGLVESRSDASDDREPFLFGALLLFWLSNGSEPSKCDCILAISFSDISDDREPFLVGGFVLLFWLSNASEIPLFIL